jgi:hypothetical protein
MADFGLDANPNFCCFQVMIAHNTALETKKFQFYIKPRCQGIPLILNAELATPYFECTCMLGINSAAVVFVVLKLAVSIDIVSLVTKIFFSLLII